MKKSAIVLAVGAALGTAATFTSVPVYAETVFYGRISNAVARWDRDAEDEAEWDVIASGSRWGVNASEDLGNGISVKAQLETAIPSGEYNGNADATGRLAWVGIAGGFGEFRIGTQWSPYYDALGAADIFNEASWYDEAYAGPFRINNSLRYNSPDLGGFGLSASIEVDGKNDDRIDDADGVNNDEIDRFQVAGTFGLGPFFIGAAYLQDEKTDDQQYGVAASFDFAGASIAALYEHVDIDDSDDLDANNYILTAQYKFANNIFKAGYGLHDPDEGDDVYEWAVGLQHNLSSSARVWVEYQDEEDDGSFLTLGLRKDW